MIITALGTGTAASALYPEYVGRRGIFVGTATGPASYNTTTFDPVSVALNPYYIDAIPGQVTSVSGNYSVQFHPTGTGTRQTWVAVWFVVSTGAQVANAVNLSAEKIQVGLFGGQF